MKTWPWQGPHAQSTDVSCNRRRWGYLSSHTFPAGENLIRTNKQHAIVGHISLTLQPLVLLCLYSRGYRDYCTCWALV